MGWIQKDPFAIWQQGTGFLVSGIVLGPSGIEGFEGYKPTDTLEKVWNPEDFEKFSYEQKSSKSI